MTNVYDFYESEKVRVLSQVPDDTKTKVEKSITQQIKKNMKDNKTNFLNVGDLLDIKEVNKYFKIIIINGPRAIGKSYSTKHFLLKRFREHNEKFAWLRNTETQALKNLTNDGLFWAEFGFHISRTGFSVVKMKKTWTSKIINANDIEDVVGYYLGVSTSKNSKSIDYKGVSWINWEEYSDNTNVKEKYEQFTSLVSTIFRLNTNAKIIMSANMLSQADPILARLGMNQKKGVSKLLTFNWLTRSIIWNIPKNHYKKNTDGDVVSYNLALAGGIDLFRQEYGGEFSSEYAHNIEKINSFKNVVDKFIIRYETYKWMVCYDTQSKKHYVVDSERRRKSNVREYVINTKDYKKYKQSKLMPYKILKTLNILWKREEIFTDEIKIAEKMIEFLDHPVEKTKITNVLNRK